MFSQANETKLDEIITHYPVKRSAVLPNVPTIAEAGYPEILKNGSWGGRQFVLAPKGTPRAIVDKLNAAINKAMAGLTPKMMAEDIGVPFHPGAVKYYKEVGAM